MFNRATPGASHQHTRGVVRCFASAEPAGPPAYAPRTGRGGGRSLPGLSPPAWGPLGRAPVRGGAFPAWGRVTVAVRDPARPNVMYVGSDDSSAFNSGGGIWKTENWLD